MTAKRVFFFLKKSDSATIHKPTLTVTSQQVNKQIPPSLAPEVAVKELMTQKFEHKHLLLAGSEKTLNMQYKCRQVDIRCGERERTRRSFLSSLAISHQRGASLSDHKARNYLDTQSITSKTSVYLVFFFFSFSDHVT